MFPGDSPNGPALARCADAVRTPAGVPDALRTLTVLIMMFGWIFSDGREASGPDWRLPDLDKAWEGHLVRLQRRMVRARRNSAGKGPVLLRSHPAGVADHTREPDPITLLELVKLHVKGDLGLRPKWMQVAPCRSVGC